jgi:hypothetical protein
MVVARSVRNGEVPSYASGKLCIRGRDSCARRRRRHSRTFGKVPRFDGRPGTTTGHATWVVDFARACAHDWGMERPRHAEPHFVQQECHGRRRIVRWLGRLLRRAGPTSDDHDAVTARESDSDYGDRQDVGGGASSTRSSAHGQASAESNWDYWDNRLVERLDERRRRLEEVRAPVKGAAVNYGAANFPHDPDVWLADWRDNLPPDDPRRNMGPPIVQIGTVQAYHKMKAAHNAIRGAYGLPPEPDDEPHSV